MVRGATECNILCPASQKDVVVTKRLFDNLGVPASSGFIFLRVAPLSRSAPTRLNSIYSNNQLLPDEIF
jgi:hypothetical protein